MLLVHVSFAENAHLNSSYQSTGIRDLVTVVLSVAYHGIFAVYAISEAWSHWQRSPLCSQRPEGYTLDKLDSAQAVITVYIMLSILSR